MTSRYFYSNTITSFLTQPIDYILGTISSNSPFADDPNQKRAWITQIEILKVTLHSIEGWICFEYSVPRMGSRIDTILIIQNILFVLEFKVGQDRFLSQDIEQVWDYAIDLNNFHKGSHNITILPILISTEAHEPSFDSLNLSSRKNLFVPVKSTVGELPIIINKVLQTSTEPPIEPLKWVNSRYEPTPTIIEAAISLYNNHSVEEITKSEAKATNLSQTSKSINEIIQRAKATNQKAICFVTGVPGAGKTLVGLDIATKHSSNGERKGSVFLSGNGPLVAILKEALTRDKVKRERLSGNKPKIGVIRSEVKTFIQNVHHFRDEYLKDKSAPYDHITIFDEAQRAWNLEQTADFMKRKKGQSEFNHSEPEFLISCLDRHQDWAVIICLVGGGQEINKGEGGIGEWIDAINRSFPKWKVFMSPNLKDSEYAAGDAIERVERKENLFQLEQLHLSVSMRSFRAENVSLFVKHLLDLNLTEARANLEMLRERYPVVITRDLAIAKNWLRLKSQGSERYGLIVSSQAQRLKPYAIDVKSPMDPVHWFLDNRDDVRSSYYLEDVATEFHVQGLELDWSCITWDADFRFNETEWEHFSFVGDRWNRIKKLERQQYLKNAYRVLLTRARQGMVIVVPEGSESDPTRKREFYDGTFKLLQTIGVSEIKY